MSLRRLVTISYTGLDAGGGVPKFNRDLHAAFPDRECVHFCADDLPSNEHRRWEWEQARSLNMFLLKTRKITHDDVIVADGFWAWGLESFPYAISHSHGIWGHITWMDLERGVQPENPFHHAAQVAFRGMWTGMGKRITAVSDFIAENMFWMWGLKVDRVINNGVDTDEFSPRLHKVPSSRPVIVHGINDRGNTNKGWDHIEPLARELDVEVLSLDELMFRWKFYGQTKANTLAGATLCVHPSGYEGNSMFVAEALACGVPVVGYDVGFLWSVKDHDDCIGRIMDRNWRSPDFTLKHVADALAKRDSWKYWGKQARDLAERHLSIQLFRQNWRHYIQQVEEGFYDA